MLPRARRLRSRSGRWAGFLVLALSSFALDGCRSVSGEPLSEAIRASAASESLCVMRHENDERNLAIPVAESLREKGVPARAVDVDACPPDARYRVTYLDRWSWDMRLYLSKMTIEVIEVSSGEIVGWGESTQDSLGALGTSHRDVIDRAVTALLAGEELPP